MVRQWSRVRPSGGRLYVNEARELFTAGPEAGVFTYVGRATLNCRFLKPQVA